MWISVFWIGCTTILSKIHAINAKIKKTAIRMMPEIKVIDIIPLGREGDVFEARIQVSCPID